MKQFNLKKILFVVFAALISNFGFSQEGVSFWSSSEIGRAVFPIPNFELDANKNLTQNEVYR